MKHLPLHKRMSTRFLLLFSIVILVGSIVGWLASVKIADVGYRKIIHQQFHTTFNSILNYNKLISQMSMILTKHMALDDKNIEQLLVTGDIRKIDDYATMLLESASADALTILDPIGNVLVRAHDKENYGDQLSSWSFVSKTIKNKTSNSAIVSDFNNLVIYAASPVIDKDGKLLGVILIGYSINEKYINNIKRNLAIEITIVRKRAIMASTFRRGGKSLSNLPIPYLEYQLYLKRKIEFKELNIFGEEYFMDAEPLKNLESDTSGSILLSISSKDLREMQNSLSKQYMAIFLIGFLIVLSLTIALSRWILNPLKAIIKLTNQISRGELGGQVEIQTNDEISLLGENFNRMVDSIREKNLAIQEHQENLEQKIEGRTFMLQKAKEEVETAIMVKDKFVALVSHDLKNPVATILGYVELLTDDGDLPEKDIKKGLRMISEAGWEMERLIDDILNLSRIKAGKINLHPHRISASFFAIKAVCDYSTIAERKEINLVSTITEEAMLYADETLFAQVIENLVSNAMKFCSKGDTVTIYQPKENATTIAVSDTGTGIKQTYLENLFSYEEKTSTVGTAGEHGTGFGLPISRDIMEAHKGTLTFETVEGKGSTFYAKLPPLEEPKEEE